MASFIDVSGLTYCGQEAQTIFSKDIYDIDLPMDTFGAYLSCISFRKEKI